MPRLIPSWGLLVGAHLGVACLGGGCSGGNPAPEGADPVPRAEVGEPLAFARSIDQVVDLALPESSRPGGAFTADEAELAGPFELIRVIKGVAVYEAPLPIRSRSLFFSSAPPGMAVVDREGEPLSYARVGAKEGRAHSWGYTAETVQVRRKESAGAPKPGDYRFRYPRAVERERSLNFTESGLSQHDFAARTLQLGPDSRTGLFLPAPALAGWTLTLPPAATLQLDGVVLPPELDVGERSDGARLIVELTEASGRRAQVLTQDLKVAEWSAVRVDLSAWAGQEVKLTFRTEGGQSDTLDYVFLAEPTVYTPTTEPKRLLLVFLDTVRADHLGTYGYGRDTTPRLDVWAKDAVVFEEARSVAPWTLPSTRAALSGRQPELWQSGPTLPERLAAEGWATGAFVGNIYLSSNFDMADGWSQYGCVNWPLAEAQVDRAQDFLARHEGRDVAVMVHTMDAHLPYTEPRSYRHLWAGDAPAGLSDGATRGPILQAARGKQKEEVKTWLIDRYDQNLRYLDDQIAGLIEQMGPNTTVVVFADHGEEFWDHASFEHGHTLYDELLRVPLMISSPGLAGGRVSEPVQLIDLTPTVLDLLGLPLAQVDGVSLLPAARGEPGAEEALSARALAFGRPLYGEERWGVLDGGVKWTTHAGAEVVYELSADPGERDDLLKGEAPPALEPLRASMGEALAREVPITWRVDTGRSPRSPSSDVTVVISHPGGIREAWLGGDPLKSSDMSLMGPDSQGVVRVTFHPGARGGRELYLVPAGDPLDIAGLRFASGGEEELAESAELTLPDGARRTLWRLTVAQRSMSVTWGLAPAPGAGEQVEGMDAEMAEGLQALGYVDDEDQEPEPPHQGVEPKDEALKDEALKDEAPCEAGDAACEAKKKQEAAER